MATSAPAAVPAAAAVPPVPVPDERAVAFMKQSFAFRDISAVLGGDEALLALRKELLAAFARNAKKSTATATSGIALPYVLGLCTSFMDPLCSAKIMTLLARAIMYLRDTVVRPAAPTERIAIVGMETAGGMVVTQLVATFGAQLAPHFDFVFMRKEKKKSGTGQQLEAVPSITERTAQSAPLRAIWVDDANSTGSSLAGGIDTLRADYNIVVEAALYVCDRSADRANLAPERMFFARPQFVSGAVKVFALCDLTEVDAEVAKLQQPAGKPESA
jgi:orotate phosphoribosyltransferase